MEVIWAWTIYFIQYTIQQTKVMVVRILEVAKGCSVAVIMRGDTEVGWVGWGGRMGQIKCSKWWRVQQSGLKLHLPCLTPSLVVLKLVLAVEGFATCCTAEAMCSRQMPLAVANHGLRVGEGLTAEWTHCVWPAHQARHTTRWHTLGQQSLQHTWG